MVTDEEGKSFVVLVKGEEAAQVPVTTGLRENGWVEIEGEDLKDGATVVTVGAYGFPDKAKIRIASAAEERARIHQFRGERSCIDQFRPGEMKPATTSSLGRFATRNALSILFIAVVLCLGGHFFRAAFAVLRVSANGFSARCHPREQRHHARGRNDGHGHATD